MRTLGKLRHEQHAAPGRAAARAREQLKLKASEWSVWRRRIALTMKLGALVAVLWLGARFVFAVGRTAEGVVRGRPVVATAPARVRVAELSCVDGQRVARGQVLARLEPVDDPQRIVLERRLAHARLRFELVQAGAGIDDFDIHRRQELLADARREVIRARIELRRAQIEERGLLRTREQLEAALRQDGVRKQSTLAVLQAQIAEAQARETQAVASAAELATQLSVRGDLAREGIVAPRDLDTLTTDSENAHQEVLARRASILALQDAMAAASLDQQLEGGRAAAALAGVDNALAGARAAAELAEQQVDAWQESVERRGKSMPPGTRSPQELGALELAIVKSEVDEREAELQAHDRAVGRMVIEAPTAGLVDRVHALAGAVLELGDPIVTTYDPAELWVEVYAPAALARVPAGTEVTIVPESGGDSVTGVVGTRSSIWIEAPKSFSAGLADPSVRFLPMRIDADTAGLQPNLKVRAVFPLVGP
ncbi:MAG: HlyD family efflux transporter periplasmic adaptor subunit [Planctomycetes bacterium]|jgi:multidrug resistance efflux pump|nr:HlyD family efflux transporter periplasmic adaptor subunit [Planctomycetota bacterium]